MVRKCLLKNVCQLQTEPNVLERLFVDALTRVCGPSFFGENWGRLGSI